ncbi:MAG: alanine--tRNA ligase [Candidatus Omnitrophica bacterium]|nr:alanine--tRNA ligase [Candidatus Omnitrophota bacterium]
MRKRFLAFFRARGHTVVPSDSLIPAKDPTLLFTGAGMNQFKDYFLGIKKEMKRAASCQKCFRTGDVEQVGQTPSHLTFFEMLGNFSFGDYFKAEAIRFAFDFLTVELKISPDRLWASVYEEDEEAYRIWTQSMNYPPERIVRFGAKENFWPSNAPADGPNGPCGPCSEIYYDYGRCLIGRTCPDPDHCSPACSCGRFVEVWNLVFTQFDRQSDGKLAPLPAKNIDTGMGLERLAAVTQDKMSVFETDGFEPIIEVLVHLLRDEAPGTLRADQRGAVYAIADHLRALTFLIGDGVVPSNEGRGYVLRMLLRKAERAGMTLGLKKPFLYKLVPVVTKIVAEGYPELTARRESIAKAIQAEEEKFQQTLEEKLPLLRQEIRGAGRPSTEPAPDLIGGSGRPEGTGLRQPVMVSPSNHDRKILTAEAAARFYDTHGLSYDEIVEVCRQENVIPPSREDFEKALNLLQAGSKASSKFGGEIFAKNTLQELIVQVARKTEFIGYDQLTAQAKVIGLIQENQMVKSVKAPAALGVILNRSPFYGESGGQVGDAGTLAGPEGKLKVTDTQWVGSVLFHRAELVEGKIQVNDPVAAEVDSKRRRQVAQNHTGTHLLHSALRKILGEHVVQAGSLVAPDHLRFDFSHGRGLSSQQRESVESLVNEWIAAGLGVSVEQTSLERARAAGAMALFGEKYEDQVRVVSIGEVSKELCGGTHLNSTREVGLLTIAEEGSIASGVRRIEALSDQTALDSMKMEVARLEQDHERLMKRNKGLEKEKSSLKVKVKGAV